jgi:hypothetical protein
MLFSRQWYRIPELTSWLFSLQTRLVYCDMPFCFQYECQHYENGIQLLVASDPLNYSVLVYKRRLRNRFEHSQNGGTVHSSVLTELHPKEEVAVSTLSN